MGWWCVVVVGCNKESEWEEEERAAAEVCLNRRHYYQLNNFGVVYGALKMFVLRVDHSDMLILLPIETALMEGSDLLHAV